MKEEIELIKKMARVLHCMDIMRAYPEDLPALADKYIALKKEYFKTYPLIEMNPILAQHEEKEICIA